MIRAIRNFDWSKTLPLVKIAAAFLIGTGAGRYVAPSAPPAKAEQAAVKVVCDCKYPPVRPLEIYLDNRKVTK